MPFNFKEYEAQCSQMSKVQLRREVEHHNDIVASAGAGTGFALLAVPLTMGLSAVAIGGTAPAIINSRKKRSIAKKYLALPGPDASTQGSSLQRGATAAKPTGTDEQLPVYTRGEVAFDDREKQTYVAVEESEMELPPSYGEATIKRMTMMGTLPPTFATREASPAMTEEPSTEDQHHPQLLRSPSSTNVDRQDTPEGSLTPRTPSPSSQVELPMDLLGEGNTQMVKPKSRGIRNPFSRKGKSVAV